MRPANDSRYNVTTSLIGWTHTYRLNPVEEKALSYTVSVVGADALALCVVIATDLIKKSHNASVPCPTMHHFVTEMCTRVHISVTKWCIVGYLSGALCDL